MKKPEAKIRIECEGADTIDLCMLNPFQGNLKTLAEEDYVKLKKEILELGFSSPFHVWRDKDAKCHILDGHQRQKTLMRMGQEGFDLPKFPIVWVGAASLKQAKKKVLALTSQYGKMEGKGLFEFITDAGISLDDVTSSFRFPDIDMDGFLDEFGPKPPADGPGGEDDVPEPPKVAKTKSGDLYVLGEHRLLCGDSTNSRDVARLLGDAKPILMATDPPYGVEYDPNWRNEAAAAGHLSYGAASLGKVTSDDRVDWGAAFKLYSAQVAYVWHDGRRAREVQQSIEDAGFVIISQIIWAKPTFAISRGDYHWQHEPCWYAFRKGKNHNWQGSRSESTLWSIPRGCSEKTGHGTEKPLACMERPVLNNTALGELVCDPFLGSGTTLIACEKNGRVCFGMEIDPIYCDVIVERWEKFSGKKAVLSA